MVISSRCGQLHEGPVATVKTLVEVDVSILGVIISRYLIDQVWLPRAGFELESS
jgi:hypothetical protein